MRAKKMREAPRRAGLTETLARRQTMALAPPALSLLVAGTWFLMDKAQAQVQQQTQEQVQERAQDREPSPEPGQQAQARFDIAAQPLVAALHAFGRQANLQLLFDETEVAGRQSQPVHGQMAPREALTRLLAGSGVQIASERAGGFALKAAPPPQPGAGGERSLAPVVVTARVERGATTEGTGTYAARGITLGKTEQTLKDIPQSVTVLTRQLIEDQQLSTLSDLMVQAPGVVVVKDLENNQIFYSRGFRLDNYQLDGAGVTFGASYRPEFDLAIYDRVELLRGAEGLYSAAGNPSGTVNLVRKRPTATWQGSASLSVGSWSSRRVEADVGGPLAFDGRLRGRLVAAHQDRDFFYSPSDEKKTVLYGVLETDLGPSTLLRAGISHQKVDGAFWPNGLPTYIGGGDIGIDRGRALTADWSRRKQTVREVFATFEHAFSPDWSVRLNLARQKFDSNTLGLVVGGPIDPATRAYDFMRVRATTNGNHADTADLGVTGRFDLWGRQHQLVAGLDWRDSKAISMHRYTDSDYPDATLDSVFNGAAYGPPGVGGYESGWPAYGARQSGVYAKLQVQATDALRVIVGGRYGRFEHDEPYYEYDRSGAVTDLTQYRYRDTGIFTPYGGVIYDLSDDWAAYASVTEVYRPQSNFRAGPPDVSRPLDPIEGRNYELGTKGSLFGGRVNSSFALYRVERVGEAAQDPAYPDTALDFGNACCYIAQGRVVSQGIDTELSGQLAQGWNVFAGYTYNQNRNKRTDLVYHAGTPRHLFKLWSTYQFPRAGSAWTVGGGVTAMSRTVNRGLSWISDGAGGSNQVPFAIRQGGYAVWNASVQYRLHRDWSLALNLKNLFDKHYYQALGTPGGANWYAEPRNVALTLRGTF